MHAQFVIEPRHDYFSYTFIAADQSIILFSRLFTTLEQCRLSIKELQECVRSNKYIEKQKNMHCEYSFVVRNKKGIILGHSTTYFVHSSRDYGIRKLAQDAMSAAVMVRN